MNMEPQNFTPASDLTIISRVSITKTKSLPLPTPHPPRFQIPTHTLHQDLILPSQIPHVQRSIKSVYFRH
ncbi:hypothetical protein CR513_18248, partial [Mucuna pruriens]